MDEDEIYLEDEIIDLLGDEFTCERISFFNQEVKLLEELAKEEVPCTSVS